MIQVLGMYSLKPAVAQFLFQSSTRKVQPHLIQESTTLINPCRPNHHWRCVGHVPEALLAFPQRRFSLPALSDIRKEPEDPYSGTRIVVDRHARNTDPYRRPVTAA